jgi:hypothetical protein
VKCEYPVNHSATVATRERGRTVFHNFLSAALDFLPSAGRSAAISNPMAEDKPKTEPTGQHSSDSQLDQQVPAAPDAEAPVFDDDSMFNSADRQSALLSQEQRKSRKQHTRKPVKQRKAG